MITVRAQVLFVFFILLAMGQLLMGAEEESGKAVVPYILKAGGGTVDVCRPDGCLLQSLPYDDSTEEPDADNRDFFAIAEDMDFDGHTDVRILLSRANNVYYDGWLWREDAGAFVKYEEMSETANLRFDAERKRVTSFTHVSATDNVTAEYAWENGRLVLMEETVQTFSPESDTFSISKYVRDSDDGVMRLIEEKTMRPDEMEVYLNGNGEREGWEPEEPEITGLNLIISNLPAETSTVDVLTLSGGEWWLRQRLDDRPMFLESRRLPAAEHHAIALEHHIAAEWPQAREIRVDSFPELAEKLTYPVLKAEFLNGENEDTDQFAAAMVFADDWTFWFVLEADVDAETSAATTKQEMKEILLGIDFVDPANGDFLPGPGIPVYATNGLDAPNGSPSLMDALIRIKKIVSPENSYSNWIGDGRLAYRFDGVDTVAGERALTFSFGSDSADEFAAVRHFTVNAAGAVYARVPAGGAAYRRVDGALPMWQGQFRNGGILLGIGMYHEGPLGFYFGGLFSGDGIENKEVLAAVDGRFASEKHLTFALDDDDSGITVSVADAADDALQQLAGRYVASDGDDVMNNDNADNRAHSGRIEFLKRYDELGRALEFDFSNLKNILFTFSSGAGAWRTNLAIRPDGTFKGQYSDANMGEQGPGYPDGTVYVCDFSGTFSSLEKANEEGYAYTLKCVALTQEGTPGDEKIVDGVKYVNAPPYGLENAAGANACTLFLPGTPYDKLPESYLEQRGITLDDGETPVLETYVLHIPSDGSEDSYDTFFYGEPGEGSDYRLYYIYWTGGEG